MGMFDTLHLEKEHPLIRCREGHPLRVFQTKTFECMLHNYVVKNDVELYRTFEIVEADEEDSLPKNAVLESINYSGSADLHTHCERCPVIYVRNIIRDRPWISEHRPSCKFGMYFKNGILKDVDIILQESLEDIKKRLNASSLPASIVDDKHPDVVAAKLSYLKRRDA